MELLKYMAQAHTTSVLILLWQVKIAVNRVYGVQYTVNYTKNNAMITLH